jgi:hypothetical protein
MKNLILLCSLVFQVSAFSSPVRNYFRVENGKSFKDSHFFLRFIVDSDGKSAYVHTNEEAYAGSMAMEFIANTKVTWPLFVGQIIPLQWHVGSTTGDCYFHTTLEVTYVSGLTNENRDFKYFRSTWTIPAGVSSSCASSGKRTFDRVHMLK